MLIGVKWWGGNFGYETLGLWVSLGLFWTLWYSLGLSGTLWDSLELCGTLGL
jgi:hypothetical protein